MSATIYCFTVEAEDLWIDVYALWALKFFDGGADRLGIGWRELGVWGGVFGALYDGSIFVCIKTLELPYYVTLGFMHIFYAFWCEVWNLLSGVFEFGGFASKYPCIGTVSETYSRTGTTTVESSRRI